MPDFSRMFDKKDIVGMPDVKKSGMSIIDIASYRQDLSDKVREHVDLIETLVMNDKNPVADAEIQIRNLVQRVLKHLDDSKSWRLKNLFCSAPKIDFASIVRTEIEKIDSSLQALLKPNYFDIQLAQQVVAQSDYLTEQLSKAIRDLKKRVPDCKDDIEVDEINKRCKTLFTQQQLVATGHAQVSDLAVDLQTRPQQAQDLLNTVTPSCRLFCLEVLSGKKKPDELRSFL